jgi:hypothetical protein
MQLGTSFYILETLLLILGLVFTIRICSFKKDAWYFYLLATITGSFQFIDLSQFDLANYINNLAMYSHDLILPLVAILIYNRTTITPKKISRDNLGFVSSLALIVSLLMIGFNYLTLPISPFTDIVMFISVIFGIVVYVGSALLVFGYIIGLLINAIYSLQYIIFSLFTISKYGIYSYNILISILFSLISFIIFLVGYTNNKKQLSN